MKIGKLVAQIIKNRPKDFFMSYLTCQSMQIFPLITGLLIREVFKCYEKGTGDNTVWWFIGFFIAGLLGRMSVVLGYSMKNAVGRFIASSILRVNLMEALLTKPGAKALKKSNGDTLNSFRDDINQIEDFVAASLIEFLQYLFLLHCHCLFCYESILQRRY
jgi:ABC-type multidrug transport system fused ATPase/permease subunit